MSVFQDEMSEASILNALAYHETSRATIFERLSDHDFTNGDYRKIYSRAKGAWSNNSFNRTVALETSVNLNGTTQVRWAEGIETIRKATYRRACEKVLQQIQAAIHDPSKANSQIATMAKLIYDNYTGQPADQPQDMETIIENLMEKLDSNAPLFVPWCIGGLDNARLEAGSLAVIGARPSIGKTAFCCSSMLAMAEEKISSGLICIEMDDTQIAARLISQESKISYGDIWKRNFRSKENLPSFQKGTAIVKESQIHLYCGRHVGIEQIQDICTDWVKHEGVKVIFIDYIQRIKHGKAESERLRVGQSSYAMKLLARKLGIPIVICSQLNRDSENKRPTLRDLKESGDIEQDADIVYLLDRQIEGQEFKRNYQQPNDFGQQEDVNLDGGCAFILAKNRNGRTGIAYLDFDGETMRFS